MPCSCCLPHARCSACPDERGILIRIGHSHQTARMTRAFVAVLLDEATRAAVADEIERLRPLSKAVAWVPASNLHFTLKFLGEQTDARLSDAALAIDEAAVTVQRFSLALHGVGGFPGMDRPRIVWVGVAEGALPFRALQARVET